METSFGTNLAALQFSGTTTYDFFSPPLTAPTGLGAQDKASGSIFMSNTGGSSANDFTVTGRMMFYDYNPATGTETLLGDTGASASQKIGHGGVQTSWSLPDSKLSISGNWTVVTGHLLHIAVIINLESGNPGGFGQFLYNGPAGASTCAILPHKGGVVWNFGLPGSMRLCLAAMSDGCKCITCFAAPNRTFAVQATTSLTTPNWITIGTASADTNGSFSFTDQEAPNYPCRYYRLTAP